MIFKVENGKWMTDRRPWARTWILIILVTTDHVSALETLDNNK
jgi:hypothetical protein